MVKYAGDMSLPLWSSALFLAVLPLVASLRASDGPELPLPVQLEEIALSRAQQKPLAGAHAFQAELPSAPSAAHLKLPGVPSGAVACSLNFPDGGELIVFRGGKGVADADLHSLMRTQEGLWSAPQAMGREGWREAGLSAPFSVSQYSPRATVAWYTEADKEPRILVSQTPDAGQRWTSAMRADIGRPEGRLSQVTLSDGSILLCWLERAGDDASLPGGLYLRRYAPNGASAMPALLAILEPAQLSSGPLLSILEDSNDGSGVLRLDYAEQGSARALRIALPSRAVLEDIDHSCRCGPAQEPGHALRARIISLDTKAGTVLLTHGAVPGLLRPGELRANLDADSLAALRPGDELLGRIQKTVTGWRLLYPRRLGGRP